MYLNLIVLPLLGSIVAGLLGRKVGNKGAILITCLTVCAGSALSLVAFYEVGLKMSPVSITLFSWIESESLNVNWGFNFDALTVIMLIPIFFISSLVHIYSVGYMSHDPHQQRFFCYLSMFTFFMVILVSADNYLLMFLAWEGVGVVSYLLVSFWYTKMEANKSSLTAMLYNRVGDMFLTIGLFGLTFAINNLDYSIIYSLGQYLNESLVFIVGISILIGSMAKSAQVPLNVWLPEAMMAPTPVSALLHAATMVTAGVYLLMRSSPLLEYSSSLLLIILWLGAITSCFAGTIGLFQNDLKKVIAYSTCSQLGMLFIAIGLSMYNAALFHLVNHAFFKALLFLAAGSVIHGMNDEQDIRRLGGLSSLLPFSYAMMLIGSLSLAAMPFLTGFYSKDLIIELAAGQYTLNGNMVYSLTVLSAVFTMTYSLRLLYLVFLSGANGPKINYNLTHEGPFSMSIPLIILALLSIVFGYYLRDFFVGIGTDSLSHSLFIHPDHIISIEAEFSVTSNKKLLGVVLSIIIGLIALLLFIKGSLDSLVLSSSNYYRNIYAFFNQRYYLELLINKFIVFNGLSLGYIFNKQLDRGAIELIGPFGIKNGLNRTSSFLALADTSKVTNYALYILLGLIGYISIIFFNVDLNGYVNIQYSQLILLYLFGFMTL